MPCLDCGGTGWGPDGKPCTACAGTGLTVEEQKAKKAKKESK